MLSRTDSVKSTESSRRRRFGIFSRKDATAQQSNAQQQIVPGMECVLMEAAVGGHLHILTNANASRSPLALHASSNGTVSNGYQEGSINPYLAHWMTAVNENAPEVHIIHAPRCLPDIPDLPVGSIALNHNRDEYSGKLFVRILTTRLFWTDRPYKLNVRLGASQTLASCSSNDNKDIQDWFLLDLAHADGELLGNSSKSYLGSVVDNLASLTVEVVPVSVNVTTKKRGFFSGLTRVKSRVKSGTESAMTGMDGDIGGQLVASLNVPLVLLAMDELENIKSQPCSPRINAEERLSNLMTLAGRARTAGVLGTFYLIDPATQEAAGEVTLHAIATPGSFVVSRALGRTVQEARHQGPLTFLRPGRTQFWQRVWGVVLGNELLLYDFQRRDRPQDWAIPLSRVVKIEFLPTGNSATGVESVLEFWLEDGVNVAQHASEAKSYVTMHPASPISSGPSKVYAYADSAEAASQWINHISMAIWGQPFNATY